MFYYLEGKLVHAEPYLAVIDCGGVGYACKTTSYTLSKLQVGKVYKLYTYLHVAEEIFDLYGFSSQSELASFKQLIGVSGVGGNTARTILSTYSPRELQSIISSGNAVLLKNVKGLGLKTAQKIIVELTGKVMTLGTTPDLPLANAASADYDEALQALQMLGFAKTAAEKALQAIVKEEPSLAVEELIRLALKRL